MSEEAPPLDVAWRGGHWVVDSSPFFPCIAEDLPHFGPHHNSVRISLDATLESSLAWEEAKDEARQVMEKGGYIFWEFQMGIEEPPFPFHERGIFNAFSLALRHWSEEVYPLFAKHTLGVSLYRGDFYLKSSNGVGSVGTSPIGMEQVAQPLYFEDFLSWVQARREREEEFDRGSQLFCETSSKPLGQPLGQPLGKIFDKELLSYQDFTSFPFGRYLLASYSIDLFYEYMHHLAAFLPGDVETFICLDLQQENTPTPEELTYMASLFSMQRCAHLHLVTRFSPIPIGGLVWGEGKGYGGYLGNDLPPSIEEKKAQEQCPVEVGVLLPQEARLRPEMARKWGEHVNSLEKRLARKNIRFKIIPEDLLTELWEGLEVLIIMEEEVSIEGWRRIEGFIAAGGDLVTFEEPTGGKGRSLERFFS